MQTELAALGTTISAVFAGVLGAVLGSFLNVCILRWGAEPKESVVRPPSRCPKCGHAISWYENIPILSWLALRARCRGCGAPISALYPAIEFSVGLLWAGAVLLLGPTVAALHLAFAGTLLLGIAATDARRFVIPFEFSIGGAVIALALASMLPLGFGGALRGALFGAGTILLIGEAAELLLGQEAMGGGDCALMGMVGAFFGWEAVPAVVLIGAAVSILLHLVAATARSARGRGRAAVPPGAANDLPASAGPRWGQVLKLFAGGLLLIVMAGVAVRTGAWPTFLRAAFFAAIGAGVAYYLSLLVPARFEGARWLDARGAVGAAAGIVVAAPRSLLAIGVAVIIGFSALFLRRPPVLAPDATEDLTGEGYIPFGVGLAVAGIILAYSGELAQIHLMLTSAAAGLGAP